jgi:hypothetical protein
MCARPHLVFGRDDHKLKAAQTRQQAKIDMAQMGLPGVMNCGTNR